MSELATAYRFFTGKTLEAEEAEAAIQQLWLAGIDNGSTDGTFALEKVFPHDLARWAMALVDLAIRTAAPGEAKDTTKAIVVTEFVRLLYDDNEPYEAHHRVYDERFTALVDVLAMKAHGWTDDPASPTTG